jgi:hypothetical protein
MVSRSAAGRPAVVLDAGGRTNRGSGPRGCSMPRGQVVLKLGADVAVLDGLQIGGGAAVVLDAGGRTIHSP